MKLHHVCLLCASPFGTRFGLCPHCGPKLFAIREPGTRKDRDLRIHSLFAWRRDGTPALRRLAFGLKRKDDPEPWLELAGWMVRARLPRGRKTLVPVPSSGRENHALGFARALAHWTGWEVRDVLLKSGAGDDSKHLNRSERARRRLSLREPGQRFRNIVIVDDIVTTGATAVSAYRALRRPRNSEVWCLLDRRPCGNWGALL